MLLKKKQQQKNNKKTTTLVFFCDSLRLKGGWVLFFPGQIGGHRRKKKKKKKDRDATEQSCYWAELQRPFAGVEDAVRQSRLYCNLLNQPSSAFPNCSFSETGSLMLLWPDWACANNAQGNSIKRQHLLWVYPTERTETRLHWFFLFFYLFVYFVLFSWFLFFFCYVAG